MHNYDKYIYTIIENECKKRGWGRPRAIYSHMMNESGWLKSSLWTKYYNGFGMKCGSTWKGKSVNMATKEEYTVGTLTSIRDNFRAYDNAQAGIAGYFDFLMYDRYKAVRESKTDEEFIEQLKACGWMTSSTAVNTIKAIMNGIDWGTPIEINRFTKENIKSLQHSINLLMDAKLVEDGIIGPKTKKALTDLYLKVEG